MGGRRPQGGPGADHPGEVEEGDGDAIGQEQVWLGMVPPDRRQGASDAHGLAQGQPPGEQGPVTRDASAARPSRRALLWTTFSYGTMVLTAIGGFLLIRA